MAAPVNPFKDSAASLVWETSHLANFRTQALEETTVADLMVDIAKLDARIAAFETASIPTSLTGASDAYPFDRDRLKREFLDEALALIIRASRNVNHPSVTTDSNDIVLNSNAIEVRTNGGTHYNLKGTIETGIENTPIGGTQIFDNSQTLATVLLDGSPNPAFPGTKYELYTSLSYGLVAYKAYGSLIDAAFAAGDTMANQTLDPSQVVTSITPTTVAGVTYDRMGTYSDITSRDTEGNPKLTQYLVSSAVRTDTASGIDLSSTGGGGQMIKLDARATTVTSNVNVSGVNTSTYKDNAQGVWARITTDASGNVSVEGSRNGSTYTSATKVSLPLSIPYGLGISPAPSDANLPIALDAYRFTANNGFDYLIGFYDASSGGSDRTFVYKLDPSVGGVADVKSLTAPEYLLHWNEARIKVLDGQLNFQKNVITELQTDLAQANDALAELQKQVATLGTSDTALAAATLKLSLFNATHSTTGKPFLTWDNATSRDQIYNKAEWEGIRVDIKNYIDRRSSEAQQATMDYQTTLGRYNSAYEIMGKLQEKLDNLVKNQLRNFG
jgi:hypothetical protein